MGTVIVVILVVAIIAAAVLFLQPRLRGGGRLGGLAARAGRRPASDRGGDGVGSRRGERKLIAEGEAIRERVEADLAQTPPAVRARDLARRRAPEVEPPPVEAPFVAPGSAAGAEGYADDPEVARRAEERRLREIARARRGGGGGGRPPR